MKKEELFGALENQDIKALEELLKKGAAVNAQDENGKTLIYKAIENNDAKAVELLLKYDADYTIKDIEGYLPTDIMYDEEHEYGYVSFVRKRKYKKIEDLLMSPYPKDLIFINRELLFSAAVEGNMAALEDAMDEGGVWDVAIRLKRWHHALAYGCQKRTYQNSKGAAGKRATA